MASGLSIHLRGYADYFSLRAWKVDGKVQKAGTLYAISCSLYDLFNQAGLTDFSRRFRRYRYAGTRYVCMPGARTPADPSFMSDSSVTGEEASYDLNVFQSVRRWTNDIGTGPASEPTSGTWNGDPYFLSDPHWFCCGIVTPWKRWCYPLIFPDFRPYPMYSEVSLAGEAADLGESSVDESENIDNAVAPAASWVSSNYPIRDNKWHDTRVWNRGATSVAVAAPEYPHLLYRVPRTLRTTYSTRVWSDTIVQFASPVTHALYSNTEVIRDLEDRLEELRKTSVQGDAEVDGCVPCGAFPRVKTQMVEKPEDVRFEW